MDFTLGVDIGQRREPSGLCAAEIQERRHGDGTVDHFVVRHLERIGAGASFPTIARRVGELVIALEKRTGLSPDIFVDATGLGGPIVELIEGEASGGRVHSVYFNHGDRRHEDGLVITLGKAWLVSRLQLLIQDDRLHLPRTPEADTLAGDLLDYQIRMEPDANDRYGAFRVGRHDDLVTALGLAVQVVPFRWKVL